MSLATFALTSVANVREVVGSAVDTDRIERAIMAVSEAFAKYTGRDLHYGASVTEFHVGHAQEDLYLRRRAIVSVSSVYIYSEAQTVATIDSVLPGALVMETVYRSDALDALGVLKRFGRWPIGCSTWGDLTGQPNLTDRSPNIRVVYTGGYITPQQATDGVGTRTLPYDLEEACIREATGRLTRPTPGLKAERTPGGWSQSWGPDGASASIFGADTIAVLDNYRLGWF